MQENIPKHVAIIMDGNRRWAKEKGLNNLQGHKKGAENLRDLGPHVLKKGIKYLSVFAFSTENFNRSLEEVKYLMDMICLEFKNNLKLFNKNNIKVIFSGRRDNLRADVLKAMDEIRESTKNNTNGVLNFCINYGGRAEIVDATKKICHDAINNKINIDDLNEEIFSSYLYEDLPPIDFLVRTSGEYRISNFMLYQAAYAEFYFTKTYFPAFDGKEFDIALDDFYLRNRRFGGNNK